MTYFQTFIGIKLYVSTMAKFLCMYKIVFRLCNFILNTVHIYKGFCPIRLLLAFSTVNSKSLPKCIDNLIGWEAWKKLMFKCVILFTNQSFTNIFERATEATDRFSLLDEDIIFTWMLKFVKNSSNYINTHMYVCSFCVLLVFLKWINLPSSVDITIYRIIFILRKAEKILKTWY